MRFRRQPSARNCRASLPRRCVGIAAQSINMSDGGWRWPWLYLAVAVASWCAAIGYWTQAEDDGTVHGPR